MYRIKEETNKVSGEKRYRVQVRLLWKWRTCKLDNGNDAIFKKIKDAETFIYEIRVCHGW